MAFFSCIILYQLIGINNISANVYSFNAYSNNETELAKFPTFSFNGLAADEIIINMNCIAEINGTGSTNCLFEKKFGDTLATSNTENNGNCVNLGSYNYDSILNTNSIDTLFYLTSSVSSYKIKPFEKILIDTTNLNLTFEQNYTDKDDLNHIKNLYFYGSIDSISLTPSDNGISYLNNNVDTLINNLDDKINNCYNVDLTSSEIKSTSYTCGISHQYGNFIRLFLFNTTYSGEIYYNVSFSTSSCSAPSGICYTHYQYGYAEIGKSKIIIANESNSGSGHLFLNPNKEYVFYMATGIDNYRNAGGSSTCSLSESDYNTTFTINIATPIWVCGEYSICENGLKSRTCVDSTGELSDRIENEICYTLPDKSIDIGFENTTNENVWFSYPTWWLPILSCDSSFVIDTKIVEYPIDWRPFELNHPQIIDNSTGKQAYLFNTLKVVNDESSKGSKSLKMWYLPPSKFLPSCSDYNNTNYRNCVMTATGNFSIGQESNVIKDINESFMIGKNITFTYPNITLSFDIKKCDEPEQQYSGDLVTFGNLSLLSCGDGYYTFDKNIHDVEETTISFSIYDYNTTSFISTHFLKTDKTTWERNEILLHDLDTTHLYRFMIGTYVNNLVDTGTYCAYVDDVEINAYTGAVSPTSYCDDEHNYYDLISLSENSYTFKKYLNDVRCFTSDFTATIENCGSKCMCVKTATDYLTYYVGDNSTGICEINEIPNSEYCVNYCKNENIKTADETVKDLLDNSGIGWASGFFSPFFLIIIVVIVIALICAYLLKSWEVFVAVLITEILIISYLWIEFAFIGIIIVAVLALYLAKLITRGG